MASLSEIRARLKEQEEKSSGNRNNNKSSNSGDNTVFPHWKIAEGTQAVLRFLPDKDPNNTFFWVERQMIRLKFPGIKGGEMKPVTIQVPCMEMYGESCPVLAEVRPWYKMNDPEMEAKASQYWKKRSYIFQGFVTENPLDEESPENPIRRFVISPQIFNIIKGALMDPDMEDIPTDFVNGTDFRIVKTTKGDYADYSTSQYSRKSRGLTDNELASLQEHGLYNLGDFLPTKPTDDQLKAIVEMFEASHDGDLYDPERWAQYYRPFGVDAPAAGSTTPEAAPAATKTETKVEAKVETKVEEEEETETATVAASSDVKAKPSTDEILAMLRKQR